MMDRKSGNIKYYPTQLELKKDSFLELFSNSLVMQTVEKKAHVSKPYIQIETVVLKAVNIKKIEKDISKDKPTNIYEYILTHPEIEKFKPEQQEKIFAFKAYLTIVQNYRDNIAFESTYSNNVKVARWI